MSTIIDGKGLALKLRSKIKEEVSQFKNEGHRSPHLAAILVGDDGASQTYVASKERDCQFVGFDSTVHKLPADTSEQALLDLISSINATDSIDGLIVQLPLPKHMDASKITEAIDPQIDVDGFHTISVGRLTKNEDTYISATPFGVMMMLAEYGIETKGKHCVVIGRSNIVGRPMSILMSRGGYPGECTVTLCHRYTQDLASHTSRADIVIVAVGIPHFLKGDMVKEGAVVIDVGITRVAFDNQKGYALQGDAEFDTLVDKCAAITPVPGGVGPMTRYGLLFNTLKSYKSKIIQ
jgi:methylenetetrahydrofolate dehydrogenase (NADP+) / methenyltetrahydrofolate cyclohydrolase